MIRVKKDDFPGKKDGLTKGGKITAVRNQLHDAKKVN